MKIIVCVKQVPDTETRIRIAPEGNAIAEADVNWVISPYDEFALEEALRIKVKQGGEVVLVGLGPERVQTALRNGLAMGADAALHLKDPAFDGADPLGVARALAADHSPDGIRVNAVGPGPIFTPFHQRRIAAAGETVEQYNARAAQGTMLKRPGRAEEVAAAILFLASDDASYVTGALLFVDGGMTAL